MLDDFISLIYPSLCSACNNPLYRGEDYICTYCRYHLPKTNFHKEQDNPVSRLFWGKADIQNACSYYYFSKDSKVQRLIHRLKYNGQQQTGIAVGKIFGSELKRASLYKHIDYIIPVPLHPARLKSRGYNQSECIGQGLSDGMEKEHLIHNLCRVTASETQTKKSLFERWKNVNAIFSVKEPEMIRNKHILLVDDVVTTGATLEACALKLIAAKAKVSIATIACAVRM